MSDHSPHPEPHDSRFHAESAAEQAREAAIYAQAAAERVAALLEDQAQPPELRIITLGPVAIGGQGNPVEDRHRGQFASVTVLNPNPTPIFLGFAGASAVVGSRSPSVPANGMLTIPLHEWDLRLGCDPAAVVASPAPVYVWFHRTVQAPFVGKTA
jgi:hypothetical protein